MLREEHPLTTSVAVSAISAGVAIGPALLYNVPSSTEHATVAKTINAEQVPDELQRLHIALNTAVDELNALSERVAQTIGRSEADIFVAQSLMLEDPELLEEVERLISQQHYSASYALQQVAEQQAQLLAALENETLAARSADIKDAAARAIRHLSSEVKSQPVPTHPVIIMAYDLTPSDTASLDPRFILGICTVVGGPTTHAAIIARTLEIPAVAGLDPSVLDTVCDGQLIALDGSQGTLYLQMDEEQQHAISVAMVEQQRQRASRREHEQAYWRHRPASTADGHDVHVFANVGDVESARAAADTGAEGIGLLRTEFLFGGRPVFPNEQEQFDSYITLFRSFAEHTAMDKAIVARTLDAGADKPFPALEPLIGASQEANPALGVRGVRIHLLHEDLLRQQLRALLRAGAMTGIDLHIMFPMISTLEEIRRLRAVCSTVYHDLVASGQIHTPEPRLGIMIETPAAALMADVLAREVDFFSIGANDLFQYVMAADRTNNRVTNLFGSLEPAVWRLIAQVVRAGTAHEIPVAVCGELASDPRIAPALIGLGVQELSMSPPAIARVKSALHQHPLPHWQALAQELLKVETAAEMQQIAQSFV